MKIEFKTKEESKREAEQAFLLLTPSQRFEEFLQLCYELKQYPTTEPVEDNGNFVIQIPIKNG